MKQLFTIRDQVVATLGYLSLTGINDVCVDGYNSLLISTKHNILSYRLELSEEEQSTLCKLVASSAFQGALDPFLIFIIIRASFILNGKYKVPHVERIYLLPLPPTPDITALYLLAMSGGDGSRSLESLSVKRSSDVASPTEKSRAEITKALYVSAVVLPETRITCTLPLDRERLLLGYSTSSPLCTRLLLSRWLKVSLGIDSGDLCVVKYSHFDEMESKTPSAGLLSAITSLAILELGERQIVVAGAADGSAAVWNLSCVLLPYSLIP